MKTTIALAALLSAASMAQADKLPADVQDLQTKVIAFEAAPVGGPTWGNAATAAEGAVRKLRKKYREGRPGYDDASRLFRRVSARSLQKPNETVRTASLMTINNQPDDPIVLRVESPRCTDQPELVFQAVEAATFAQDIGIEYIVCAVDAQLDRPSKIYQVGGKVFQEDPTGRFRSYVTPKP